MAVSVEVTGQETLVAALAGVGTSQQTEVDAALTRHGTEVRTEAIRLAPKRTGATANAVTSTFTPVTGLEVNAHTDTNPAAYTFHAVALGKSSGGFTFRVHAHTRAGRFVTGYSAKRYIKNNPYLFTAWTNRFTALQTAVTDALTRVVTGG